MKRDMEVGRQGTETGLWMRSGCRLTPERKQVGAKRNKSVPAGFGGIFSFWLSARIAARGQGGGALEFLAQALVCTRGKGRGILRKEGEAQCGFDPKWKCQVRRLDGWNPKVSWI